MRIFSASLISVLLCGLSTTMAASSPSLGNKTPETLESLLSRATVGNEKAQMKLAIIYLEGRGVNANPGKALYYYRLAAERDIPYAQHKLALLYLDENYVKPKPGKALHWLQRSAKLGYVRAQLDLSLLYENGTTVDQDLVGAHLWLSIASSLTKINLKPRLEELEGKMTFTERAHAELLASICILTVYESC